MRKTLKTSLLLGFTLTTFSSTSLVANNAYKVMGKTYTIEDTAKRDPSGYYDMEKKRYNYIQQQAQTLYLEEYWKKNAKAGETPEQAEARYTEEKAKVTDKEINETLEKFKDHPQLKQLPKDKQKEQVVGYLKDQAKRRLITDLLEQASKKGDLSVLVTPPKEPIFKIDVQADDLVKFGPKATDIQPIACKGNDCAITVVEYSEYQCPYCAKVLPDIERLMEDYKGKIRWVVRDYLLPSHDRAMPAAIAAKCSAEQGKYWEMYQTLFENQRQLEDADILKYAKNIKLDEKKFADCFKNPPKKITEKIASNMATGSKLGVDGTPAFFINGRRIAGAVPISEFKRIMDEELKGTKAM